MWGLNSRTHIAWNPTPQKIHPTTTTYNPNHIKPAQAVPPSETSNLPSEYPSEHPSNNTSRLPQSESSKDPSKDTRYVPMMPIKKTSHSPSIDPMNHPGESPSVAMSAHPSTLPGITPTTFTSDISSEK